MTKEERDELRKLADLSKQANKHGSENFDMLLCKCSAAIPSLLDHIEKLENAIPHVGITCKYHTGMRRCDLALRTIPYHVGCSGYEWCPTLEWQLKEVNGNSRRSNEKR